MARSNQGNQQKKGNGPRRGGNRGGGQTRNYLKPPTDQSINHEARAATNQKFRPLERSIAGDLRASNRRVGEQGDWWQNYLNTVNQGQADTSAAYAQAGATNQAQMGQASAIDTANTQRLQGEAGKSAELRGAAPSTAPAEREAAMQGQRNYLANAQAGTLQAQGASERGYLNEQKRIGVGQSIASRQAEQRRGRSIRNDMTAARKERGEYGVTKRGELRDKAQERQIQKSAFGLDKRKAGNEEREASVAASKAGREAREDAEENRRKNEGQRNENTKTRREGKPGAKTPSERNKAREGKQNALATTHSFVKSHGWPKDVAAKAELEREVAKESEVSAADARWAVNTYLHRHKAEHAANVAKNAIPNLPN
jgi:hypothetical protein